MIQGLNHITLAVKDLEKSFHFYSELLGFRPLMKSDSNAYFLAGDLWFCIQVDKSVRTQSLPEYSHIAFTVPANFFEQLKQILISNGVVVWKENSSEGDSFYFLVPDQHKLEIHVGDWRSRLERYEIDPDIKMRLFASGKQGYRNQAQNLKTKKIVEEKEIRLIGFKNEFVDSIFEWRNQPAMLTYNPIEQKSKQELQKEYQNESSDLTTFTTSKSFRWFIEYQSKIVGHISFKNINKMMMTTEIGYGLDQVYFGRGLGATGVIMSIRNLFNETPIRKIIAYVHEENESSLKLLNRVGFSKEGFLREHYIINRKPVNEIILGLLREDFKF